jgi:hypothetical protein
LALDDVVFLNWLTAYARRPLVWQLLGGLTLDESMYLDEMVYLKEKVCLDEIKCLLQEPLAS